MEVYIDHAELLAILKAVNRTMPVTIVAETDARAKKNPFGKILKKSRVNGFIAYGYENIVNNKLKKIGQTPDFEAGERKWGEHYNTQLIMKGNKYYLPIYIQRVFDTIYFIKDGQILTKEQVKPYLPSFKEEFVIHREYTTTNIKEITINGVHYYIA
jgi:hypothetical protein